MQKSLWVAPFLFAACLACSGCDEPARYPIAPSVAPAPAVQPKLTSVEVEAPAPIVFEDLFLQDADARDGMHHLQTVAESRPNHPIFVCLGGPGGKQSALSEWADPDSREALWRVSDLRWVFDDVTAAEAFRVKLVAHFAEKTKSWETMPCNAPLGEACTRVLSGTENFHGEPHTEIGFVFRIGTVVAEVEGAEGPRVGSERISDTLVMPFAKRAEERIRSAITAASRKR